MEEEGVGFVVVVVVGRKPSEGAVFVIEAGQSPSRLIQSSPKVVV